MLRCSPGIQRLPLGLPVTTRVAMQRQNTNAVVLLNCAFASAANGWQIVSPHLVLSLLAQGYRVEV